MSILIKGMEIPENGCDHCFLRLGNYCRQIPTDESMIPYAEKGARHPDCPLVPVPPHGRLIDADALIDEQAELAKYTTSDAMRRRIYSLISILQVAPIIIPQEEEHNGE